MSAETPNWNPNVSARGLKVAIVVARFNEKITGALLQGAQQALTDTQADAADVYFVPGAYELPFAAKKLTPRYDAIVALGAVVRGDTPHFDYVAGEAAKGVGQAGVASGVPVIFGVLTTDTMQQALERAGIKSNLGWSYGLQAIEMGSLMAALPG